MSTKVKKVTELEVAPYTTTASKTWNGDVGQLQAGLLRTIEPIRRPIEALKVVTDNLVDGVWDASAMNNSVLTLPKTERFAHRNPQAGSYNFSKGSSNVTLSVNSDTGTYSWKAGSPNMVVKYPFNATLFIIGGIGLTHSNNSNVMGCGAALFNTPTTAGTNTSTNRITSLAYTTRANPSSGTYMWLPIYHVMNIAANTTYNLRIGLSASASGTITSRAGRTQISAFVLR